MSNGPDLRRAPRTVVDVEAEFHLSGLRTYLGVIRDLSHLGCLFVPEAPIEASLGSRGTLRFALPTTPDWLEPNIAVRRIESFTRSSGGAGQGIGMEFSGISAEQQEAIVAGCREWDSHRMRQYELSARCFVQSEGGMTHYARFGQLLGGTRSYLHLTLPVGSSISRGMGLRLKMARTWIAGRVETISEGPAEMDVSLRIEGWGRDFFLHEARRQSISD
jgi:hypothetical protein